MKKLLTIMMLLGAVFAADVCAYYFWGQGCPHCAITSPYLDKMASKYENLNVEKFEIYHNNENYQNYDSFCTQYCVERRGIPMVIIDDNILMGDEEITSKFEPAVLSCIEKGGCECPDTGKSYNVEPGHPSTLNPEQKTSVDLFVVASAALVDSINPCAFAVMIFLLTYLMTLGAKRRIWKVGIAYISVVFLTYLAAGLGLFVTVQTVGMSRFVYRLAAFLAIGGGLINLKDFFFYGKGFSLEIPKSKKPIIEKYVKMASLPAAVVLGFLVALFELPCTGGVYLAILGMLSNKMTATAALPYLVLYNIIFVLPLVAILFLVNSEFAAEKAEHWRLKRRKYMKLGSAILMLVLGGAMLAGWI